MNIRLSQTFLIPFVLIIIFFTKSYNSTAQLLVGAKAGAQVSWIKFDNKDNQDLFKVSVVPGYNIGLVSSFRVQKRFFLQTELIYSRTGRLIESKLDPMLENRVINHHLNIPIIYKVHFKGNLSGKEFKWHIGFGPNLGYWLKALGTLKSSELEENDIESLDYQVSFKYDPDLPDQEKMYVEGINRFQLGLNFSTGMDFEPIGGTKILIDLRYELGSSLFAKSDRGQFSGLFDYFDPMRIRSNVLQLSVAYLIDTNISQSKKGKRVKQKVK